MLGEGVVEIAAAEVTVPGGAFDDELAFVEGGDGDLRGS